jgi:hypothetical protein
MVHLCRTPVYLDFPRQNTKDVVQGSSSTGERQSVEGLRQRY